MIRFFFVNPEAKAFPKAEGLAERLPVLISELEELLANTIFDPAHLRGKMTIALNAFTAETHGYQLYEAITQAAPSLDVEIVNLTDKTTIDLLSGEVDFSINYYPIEVSKELRQIPIGQCHFGGVVRSDHPLANSTTSVAEALKYDISGLIIPEYNSKNMRLAEFEEAQRGFKPKFRAQSINPVLKAVEQSDLFFVAPREIMGAICNERYSWVDVEDDKQRNCTPLCLVYNNKHSYTEKYDWVERLCRQVLKL
ncbi:LysR substrate-binding domain-containing protein [Vibrio mexicanus]|uniref:LysR substrate-binding domain-containing protein n=1 Tax=Vibrio mexicanus TaxID=1004326 RepID=UPI000B0B573B|nr:LysR substrate-binding domain-containing protein [Vibrio mexicanus]